MSLALANNVSFMSDNLIKQMFEAGAHFGYKRSRRHPSVKPFLFGNRDGLDIIDLEKTEKQLIAAKKAIAEARLSGKPILFVGSKHEVRNLVKKAAEMLEQPYVTGRWIGGTLTNFSEIRKRVERLLQLQNDKEKGVFEKYTKKERVLFDREIARLQEMFGGLVKMEELPSLLVIIDPCHEHTATKEANQMNIPIVALSSTDCDITNVNYPVVANDSAVKSVEFFVNQFVNAFSEAQNKKEEK